MVNETESKFKPYRTKISEINPTKSKLLLSLQVVNIVYLPDI